ncbi:MAG: hypothetical protein CVT90_01235 [Candidatus Altiarchaeales archaeon HGW-Altiarchaeales-3]|nr:MAG: hypothetical protein CVT90_01235 [Candidatus Altiarchaeales archaeon HGW-Altiarchaeales-3]
MTTKNIKDIGKISLDITKELLKKEAESVISIIKESKEWKVVVEALERKAVPDTQDIMGRYELTLDTAGEILDYKQVMLRRRSDLVSEV